MGGERNTPSGNDLDEVGACRVDGWLPWAPAYDGMALRVNDKRREGLHSAKTART